MLLGGHFYIAANNAKGFRQHRRFVRFDVPSFLSPELLAEVLLTVVAMVIGHRDRLFRLIKHAAK